MSGLLRTTGRRLYGQPGNSRGRLVFVLEDTTLVNTGNLEPFDPKDGGWQLLETHVDHAVFGYAVKFTDKWGNACVKLVGSRDEAKEYNAVNKIGVYEIEWIRWIE